MSTDFFIGRQPILDEKGQIYAYELLFRHPGETSANVMDNSAATARVLINAIQNMGLTSVLGGKKGFINVDESIIMGGLIEILPKEQFVIEILETTKVTPEVVEKVKEYKGMGYSFALDDVVLSKEYYEMFRDLFAVVDVIKVDYLFCDKEKLKKNMGVFSRLNVKILAEKVETQDDHNFCQDAGFNLYQGYFFAKPVIITSKSLDPSKAATIQLINMLREDADASQLEKVIKNYPDLYINLLKFMNSAAFFTKGRISSIKHAMALLGRENLSKWLYLILYAGPNNDSFDNPLLMTAQIRARTMESLCRKSTISNDKAGAAYLVGLISLMDVVFGKKIEEIVDEFNLDDAIKEAVTVKKGDLGLLLQVVTDYEQDNIAALEKHFKLLGLKFEDFNSIILDSFEYAENVGNFK